MDNLFIAKPSSDDLKKGRKQQVHALGIDEIGPTEKTRDPRATGIAASLGSAAPSAAGVKPPAPCRSGPVSSLL
eukprot:4274303-Prorocentrum_lima.AAC.1